MEEILGNIYCWAESFYGDVLSEHLWGFNCENQDYSNELIYNQIGGIALVVSGVLSAIYYYLWCPVRRQMLYWWLMLILTGIVNWTIAFLLVKYDLDNGLIGDCLLYNDSGIQQIDILNIVYFGIVNALFASVAYFLISLIIKWGSKTVKYYPF